MQDRHVLSFASSKWSVATEGRRVLSRLAQGDELHQDIDKQNACGKVEIAFHTLDKVGRQFDPRTCCEKHKLHAKF